MSLFTKLCETYRSWRRRRGGPKTTQRTKIDLEQLGHRQLLAVNFTGNVVTDFPATLQPGVVVLPDGPGVVHPVFATGTPEAQQVANLIKVSGFDINGMRVTYTPADDTLSIGIEQPNNQKTTPARPVIAGDADNNQDSGTTNPAITALIPSFQDIPDLGGTEALGAFLQLNPNSSYDVVAGYTNNAIAPKQYQVALAADPNNPSTDPASNFGTSLPTNTGNVFLVNDINHPNFEFSIKNFSVLYQQQTGQTLTANSTFKIGAFGSSLTDTASEALYPLTQVRLGDATPATPPPPVDNCPPASPKILINPHQARHINTAHNELVRVYVFGTSGFPVANIDPASVRLGGAVPVSATIRKVNRDEFPDEVFVFKGTQIHLPAGITTATISGKATSTTDPTQTIDWSSSETIFNRDFSFYPASQAARQKARLGLSDTTTTTPSATTTDSTDTTAVTPATVTIPIRTGSPANSQPITVVSTPGAPSAAGNVEPLKINIPRRGGANHQKLKVVIPTVQAEQITAPTVSIQTRPRGSAVRFRQVHNVKM